MLEIKSVLVLNSKRGISTDGAGGGSVKRGFKFLVRCFGSGIWR